MNSKGKKAKKQVVTDNSTVNVLSQEEHARRIAAIQEGMKASTWRELETNGKLTKNDKLTFISDDMLILGCDIGSETHYARAIDSRGRELSGDAFPFSNSEEGFQSAKAWALELAATNGKRQIVLGLEPTGYYWFCNWRAGLCTRIIAALLCGHRKLDTACGWKMEFFRLCRDSL